MTITANEESLRAGLVDLTAYDDWIDSVDQLRGSLQEHPTQGEVTGFNIHDDEQLRAQMALNGLVNAEGLSRRNLSVSIAERDFGGLDVIAKLSVIYGLANFTAPRPLPKPKDDESFAESIFNRVSLNLYSGRTFGEGVSGVFYQAGLIDTGLRAVDSAVRNKSKVSVHEDHSWSELRTLYKPGHSVRFNREIDTKGVVRSKVASFKLLHPIVRNNGVEFAIPNTLEVVEVTSTKGKSTRDYGEPFPENMTHLIIESGEDGEKPYMSVPLIAISKAMGLNVSKYVTGRTSLGPISMNNRNITVTIGRTTLSNEI